MKVTVITPTGGRPEAFSLCEKYMKRQILKPDQWIVVDDCIPRTKFNLGQEIITPAEIWKPGDMTLTKNLLHALDKVTGDIILIMEDDDWYAPNYIKTMVKYLQVYDLAGEGNAKYYNIYNFRKMIHTNQKHASLCQTGFTKNLVPAIIECIKTNIREKFIDIEIWKLECNKKVFPDSNICVGIKGMTGRGGIGYGHRDSMGSKDRQPGLMLKRWIGEEDARIYEHRLWN